MVFKETSPDFENTSIINKEEFVVASPLIIIFVFYTDCACQ